MYPSKEDSAQNVVFKVTDTASSFDWIAISQEGSGCDYLVTIHTFTIDCLNPDGTKDIWFDDVVLYVVILPRSLKWFALRHYKNIKIYIYTYAKAVSLDHFLLKQLTSNWLQMALLYRFYSSPHATLLTQPMCGHQEQSTNATKEPARVQCLAWRKRFAMQSAIRVAGKVAGKVASGSESSKCGASFQPYAHEHGPRGGGRAVQHLS